MKEWIEDHIRKRDPQPRPQPEGHGSLQARWDLLPWESLRTVAQVLAFATTKYGPDPLTSASQVPLDDHYWAAQRHLLEWAKNPTSLDWESHLPSLAHAATRVLLLLALSEGHARAPHKENPTSTPFDCACSSTTYSNKPVTLWEDPYP